MASRDWHPGDHCSFAERGGGWPAHCVQGDARARSCDARVTALRPALVVSKGDRADREAYSAFDGTGLVEALRERGIERLLVGGLATDYCVRATALDALRAGFEVVVVDGRRVRPSTSAGDGERALAEVREAGGTVTASDRLPVHG